MRENFTISADKNNGYPSFSDSIDLDDTDFYKNKNQFIADGISYPKYLGKNIEFETLIIKNTAFYTFGNYPEMKNTKYSLISGAFANAKNLAKVVIPKSATFIGENAFRNTVLSSAKISVDCTYFPKSSFPNGCDIDFYPYESNFITADGYEIWTADGYLFQAKEDL